MKGFLAILGLVGGAYLVYAFVLDAGDQATVRSLWGDTTPPGAAKQYGDILTSTAFLKALASVAAITTGTRAPISVWEVNART